MNSFESALNLHNQTRLKYRNQNLANGDIYNEKQRRAEQIFKSKTGFATIPANLHGPSCLDGFLVKDGLFRAGYEVKTRNYTFSQLSSLGDFILSQDKVVKCIDTCKNLCIPFVAICYSIPDDDIRVWLVSDDRGKTLNFWKFSEKFVDNGKTTSVYNFPYHLTMQI